MAAVGTLATISTVSGLAIKSYKFLNGMLYDIAAVPDYLTILESELYMFTVTCQHLQRYIKKKSTPESDIQEIRRGIKGANTIIEHIYKQLSAIRFEKVTVNGKVVSKVPPLDRLQFWLNEELITRWKNELATYCAPLTLLLKVQELDSTDSDDESSIDIDDSTPLIPESEINEWIREDRPAGKISSSKQKIQKVSDGRDQLRQEYRQLLSMKSQEFNNWQLRVVVLGRGGVGKTRLASHICGLPYEGNAYTSERTLPESINVAMNIEKSKRIALHDSGGLEGRKTVSFAQDFISKKQTSDVRDQIHAIWYVISCSDPNRAVNETDEEFLAGELIDTEEIPIFVVFSKYDKLNAYVRETLQKKDPGVSEDEINRETYEQFNNKIYNHAKQCIKDKSKVFFSRIGIQDDGSEYLQSEDGGPSFGLESLTKQIESRLPNGYLQIQFVVVQQKDDRAKLYDSINASIALLFTARTYARWSIYPGICVLGLANIYNLILNMAATFWGIDTWKDSLSPSVLRAIFDQDRIEQYGYINMLTINIAGSLTMSVVSKIALRMILGVNLIGRRIFRLKALSKTPLMREAIKAEIADFQKSEDRKRLAETITSSRMAQIDFKTSDTVTELSRVAQEALEASVGYVDATFFSEERIRVMQELSTVDVGSSASALT